MNLKKSLSLIALLVVVGVATWFVSASVARKNLEASVQKAAITSFVRKSAGGTTANPVAMHIWGQVDGRGQVGCWEVTINPINGTLQYTLTSLGQAWCNNVPVAAPHAGANQK